MKKVLLVCLLLSVLFLLVAVVSADDMGKAQTVKGWVADAKCGVRAPMPNQGGSLHQEMPSRGRENGRGD